MSRCERHDLEIGSCADCSPRPGQFQATARPARALGVRVHGPDPGPWFIAAFGGSCSGCGEDIEADDEIRADGSGGWERRECCGDLDDLTAGISAAREVLKAGDEAVAAYLLGVPVTDIRRVSGGHRT